MRASVCMYGSYMLLYVCVLFLQGLDCQSLRDPVIRTPREWGAISPNMHMRDSPPPPQFKGMKQN